MKYITFALDVSLTNFFVLGLLCACYGTLDKNKLVVHKNQEKRADNCNTKKIHDAEEEERSKLAE